MSIRFSRRAFLASATLTCAASLLPLQPALAATPRRLSVQKRTIEVHGRPADVFGITADDGSPGLVLGSDERFRVALNNRLVEETIVHWHGQVPAPGQDGVTDTGYVTALKTGEERSYDFSARPGTHWMHSHQGLQEQQLLAAPLIVRTAEDETADYQEVTVILHDFSFRSPAEILSGLTGGMVMDHGGMAMDMDMSAMDQSMAGADLNDVEYDAFLANDRTLDDPEVVRTENQARVRLRVINASASTGFWLDLSGHTASVIAVDGNPVAPVLVSRAPLAQAQRIDLLIDLAPGDVVPVFAQREGDTVRTGIVLATRDAPVGKLTTRAAEAAPPVDLSLESKLAATTSLQQRKADVEHAVMLTGSMSPYVWTVDDRSWEQRRPLVVREGQRVEIELMNHTMMAHPIHLHGHHFQVVGIAKQKLAGAVRDTVLIPAMGTVRIAFDADNPGRWLYHCHNLYHMAAGMMSELVYEGV
jgi:FtsP/CotA-like multicopper oxidase with cupredoxin domain